MKIETLIEALRAVDIYPYRDESSYSDVDAKSNLEGRTHYVDSNTLKFFNARILRGTHSNNGLFYILQESLPHPDFGNKRVKRNVLFDVFGHVVVFNKEGEVENLVASREVCYTSSSKADKGFSDLVAWADSPVGEAYTLNALKSKLYRQKQQHDAAAKLLTE